MGFKLPVPTERVEMDGPYQGAVVTMKTFLPLGEFLSLQGYLSEGGDASREALRYIGDHLIDEWNLEDAEGNPLAVSGEALMVLPHDLGMAIAERFLNVVGGSSDPLAPESPDGLQLEAASTVTDSASISPSS